jgi:hypothetical protein
MLTKKQEALYSSIYTAFYNGNLEDAAKQVRGLKKLDVFRIVVCYSQYDGPLGAQNRYNFEDFIERALMGVYK